LGVWAYLCPTDLEEARGSRVAGGGGGRDFGGAEAARVPLELSGWGPPVGLCRGRGERQRQLVPGV